MRHMVLVMAVIFVTGCTIPLPTSATPNIPSGSVLYREDFSNVQTGWKRVQNDGGIMDYDGGGYRILVTTAQANVWATPGRDFGDARVEVDAGKFGGPDANRIGLICRAAADRHYFFILGSDGYYGLGIFTGGKAALLGQAAMQQSDSVLQGAAVNHIRLDCAGSQLTGYINDVQVARVEDATLARGDVGVLAGTFEQPGTDVIFDNFVVMQP